LASFRSLFTFDPKEIKKTLDDEITSIEAQIAETKGSSKQL